MKNQVYIYYLKNIKKTLHQCETKLKLKNINLVVLSEGALTILYSELQQP